MKSTVQKILAVLVVVLLVAEIIHASKLNQKDSVTLAEKRPLLIWYTDPDIQEYMQQSAEAAAAQYGVCLLYTSGRSGGCDLYCNSSGTVCIPGQ